MAATNQADPPGSRHCCARRRTISAGPPATRRADQGDEKLGWARPAKGSCEGVLGRDGPFPQALREISVEQLAQRILEVCHHARLAANHQAGTEGPERGFTGPGQRFIIDTVIDSYSMPVTVHVLPVELLTGIDVIVSSENTYLQMSKTFRDTVSGSLRRGAAIRGPAGEIIDDVLARELADGRVKAATACG